MGHKNVIYENFDWHKDFNAYYFALLINVIEMHVPVKKNLLLAFSYQRFHIYLLFIWMLYKPLWTLGVIFLSLFHSATVTIEKRFFFWCMEDDNRKESFYWFISCLVRFQLLQHYKILNPKAHFITRVLITAENWGKALCRSVY